MKRFGVSIQTMLDNRKSSAGPRKILFFPNHTQFRCPVFGDRLWRGREEPKVAVPEPDNTERLINFVNNLVESLFLSRDS